MRKTVIALVALGLVVASTAFAASFWTETFNYPNGDLTVVSGGAWTTHSGTLPTDVQVVSGEAVASSSNAPDDNHQFRTQAEASPTDVIYSCFRLKVSGTQTAAGTYFAHFMNTGTYFAARVFAALNDASTFKLGINTSSATPTFWATPLQKNTYYNIAIKYDAVSGLSTMWVDPASEFSTSIVGPTSVTGTLISGFAIRQSSGYGTVTIDDIGVGTTFEDACTGHPTPTNGTTWGKLKSLYR